MTRPLHRTPLLLGLIAATSCCALAIGATEASAQILTSDNPYISDGSYTESPFKFSHPVTEVRPDVNQFNQPMLIHVSSTASKTIVEDFKKTYKKAGEVSPGFKVAGYAFLTQQGNWSFTLYHQKTQQTMILEVKDNPEGAGSLLVLHARPMPFQSATWRRDWLGYSPVGLDPYSLKVRDF